MAIKNHIDWKELFMTPYPESFNVVSECPYEQYFNHLCYPEELNRISVEERHAEGFFFDDEINKSNAADVKYVRTRQIEFTRPDPWDMEGYENLSDAQLFKQRMLDGYLTPFVLPDFDLPNLEKVCGDVIVRNVTQNNLAILNLKEVIGTLSVFGCCCDFDSLQKVNQLISETSDVYFHSLSSVDYMKITSGSNVSCNNLIKTKDISVYDSTLECPYLKSAREFSYRNSGGLNVLDLPLLERLSKLEIWVAPDFQVGKFNRPGDITFPALKSVDNYINVRGKQGLVCPLLESALGLTFHSDGILSMPSLLSVGKYLGDRGVFGSLEISKAKRVDLSSLKDVFGDFELCNGVVARLDVLEKVHGSFDVNCGHWISVGSNGIVREPVEDDSVRTIRIDSLKFVGNNLSVYNNTDLQVPKLNKVGGTVNMHKNASMLSKLIKHQWKKGIGI